jgi:hypothetical protein
MVKGISISMAAAIAIVFLLACNANKKLAQENAEKAIRTIIATHTGSASPKEAQFNEESIVAIRPVSQFLETDASAVVKFKDSWLGRLR